MDNQGYAPLSSDFFLREKSIRDLITHVAQGGIIDPWYFHRIPPEITANEEARKCLATILTIVCPIVTIGELPTKDPDDEEEFYSDEFDVEGSDFAEEALEETDVYDEEEQDESDRNVDAGGEDDIVRKYLNEVGAIPLIPHEKLMSLFMRFDASRDRIREVVTAFEKVEGEILQQTARIREGRISLESLLAPPPATEQNEWRIKALQTITQIHDEEQAILMLRQKIPHSSVTARVGINAECDRRKLKQIELLGAFTPEKGVAERITAKLQASYESKPAAPRSLEDIITIVAREKAESDQIKRQIFEGNLRLAVWAAKRYVNRARHLRLLDLIQEGNLGLLRAIDGFDYRRGFGFSTYAVWWIRQSITRAIQGQERTIRVPVHMGEQLRRLVRDEMMFTQQSEKPPTAYDLASSLGLSYEKIEWLRQIEKTGRVASLDAPVRGEKSELDKFVPDIFSLNPVGEAVTHNLQKVINKMIAGLSPREQRVIRRRFGFGVEQGTLEEIGKEFALTRERIRQIEFKALRRLRHPSRRKLLEPFLDGD